MTDVRTIAETRIPVAARTAQPERSVSSSGGFFIHPDPAAFGEQSQTMTKRRLDEAVCRRESYKT